MERKLQPKLLIQNWEKYECQKKDTGKGYQTRTGQPRDL
jgi:hypothetical protein